MLEDAFLQDILENPDDDTPRLIYADWLTDRGDPRGEFIQVQCRIAQAGDPFRSGRLWGMPAAVLKAWRAREQELLASHGERWRQSLRSLATEIEFHRGFPERVTVPADEFLARGGELFRATPIREVRFPRDSTL
jgi:uncharacterized protein (TIGR02996 family)